MRRLRGRNDRIGVSKGKALGFVSRFFEGLKTRGLVWPLFFSTAYYLTLALLATFRQNPSPVEPLTHYYFSFSGIPAGRLGRLLRYVRSVSCYPGSDSQIYYTTFRELTIYYER